MAYKKFIKRGGKIFGPYYYESYRGKNGKVKKMYLGTVNPDGGGKKVRSSRGIFSFLSSARKKVDPTKNNVFRKVFLIPFVVLLVVVFGAIIYNQIDSRVIVGESFDGVKDFISGSFFKIAGFVVSDVDESAPLGISQESGGKEDSGGGEEEVAEEVAEETSDSGELQEDISDGQELVEESEVELEDGEVVESFGEDSDELVESEETGGTLVDETIIGELVENETVGEVNETLVEAPIGQDPAGPENETFIDEIVVNETIELNETLVNETIDLNQTIELNETLVNETVVEVNESLVVASVEGLTTLQYKAIIHRPVKWMKKINVSVVDNLTIEIPKLAENVRVLTDEEIEEAEQEIEDYEILVGKVNKGEIVSGLLTGNVVVDINSGKGFFTKFWDWFLSFSISGNVVLEDELEAGGVIVETTESKIVDVERIVNETDAKEVAVEYYTPAPFVVEQNISGGKLVTVSADDVYNYTDVLAYSLVEGRGVLVNSSLGLKVYWRASYEDAVRYGYIEEGVVVDYSKNEKVPKKEDSNESKEKKEKDESVENETLGLNETLEEVNETVIEENETFIDEIVVNETMGLGEDDKKVKDGKEKGKENKTEEIGKEKKSLITGGTIKGVADEGLVAGGVGENESVATSPGVSQSMGGNYIRVEVNFSVHDLDGDGFVDYVEWIVPHLSNQTYEISIEILNVQSYPTVGGNWAVGFNTTGEANLTVSAFNGTTYGFDYFDNGGDEVYDLEFLETRCGEEVLNVSVVINGTTVPYDVYLKKKRIEEIRRELEDGE